MNFCSTKTGRVAVYLTACVLAISGVRAEKPDWAGEGKHGKHEKQDKQQGKHQGKDKESHGQAARQDHPVRVGAYFGDTQRVAVHTYYRDQYRTGACPPGLAKKNNGCMPPGQARKWAVGQPLPHSVTYYSLAPAVVVQLGVPPSGYRYVRVASDILLIAIGTAMVVDAIQDLGRL
ncbi:MAG TPA: hypothetical protein VLJ57_06445 [Burkholderiaceae bacterium]|nr:hypothetical protein [Burkholderiaceae bacterium]